MNYAVLRREIIEDPEGVGYHEMSPAEIRDSLNSPDHLRSFPLTPNQVLEWSADSGRYARIHRNSNHDSDEIYSLCRAVLRFMDKEGGGIDLSNPLHDRLVKALVSTTVLSGDDYEDLVAASQKEVSRASLLGLGVLRKMHVERAINGN